MAISVRLDATLEARLDLEAKRRGVTKSEVIKDALERILGGSNPYQLLKQICISPDYAVREPTTNLSENAGERLKEMLRAKHAG